MMKRKLLYIAGVVTLLLGTGCSHFLKEEDLSNATAENFYVTQTGYESLINACYSSLRDVYEPIPYMFCAGTDLFVGSHQSAPLGLTTYETLSPGDPTVADFFQTLYKSIQICNTAIAYGDKTAKFAELQSRIGEARFLRAYYYFLLVQTFGNVSLVTNMVDKPITHFDRDSASKVYDFVISELKKAASEVPATQADWGRVTKRAAQDVLARVYLTRGYEKYAGADDFKNAAAYADSAIAGQTLSVPYDQIFGYENDVNPEVLFSVQYDQSSLLNGGAHNWDAPWGPLIQGAGEGVSKKNILHPTEHLFELYGPYDSRFEGTFMNVLMEPYVGYYLNPKNSPVVYYYPRTPGQLADTAAWRAEDPANRAATVIVPEGPVWWDENNQTDYPALMKYDRVQTADVHYTHDLFLCRLGETYLTAAEAYFKMGQLQTAADRINAVRERAAMPGHEADMKITAADVNIDFILDERARELAGEGFRWFALKRTGKLMEYCKKYNPQIQALYNGGGNPFLGAGGNYKILRPIPLSAISLDAGDYPQNPAYQ
jgi:hypothetical protein